MAVRWWVGSVGGEVVGGVGWRSLCCKGRSEESSVQK